MKLGQLEDQIKRKEAKEPKKSVILTPHADPIVITHAEQKVRYPGASEYRAQRRMENSFLRNHKCPECQSDVSVDGRGNNVFWYTCLKDRRHSYIRVGQLPSLTEEEMVESMLISHNLD